MSSRTWEYVCTKCYYRCGHADGAYSKAEAKRKRPARCPQCSWGAIATLPVIHGGDKT